MKHFMFVTNFLPHVGGLEHYVHDLASALSNDWKEEVHIICFDNSEEPSKSHGLYIVHRIRRIALIAGVFAIPHPLSALRILRIVKQSIENDSVVWSHTRFFISSLMAVIIAKLWHLPSLHIEHGSSFVVHSSRFIGLSSRLWDETVGRLVYRLADHVVATSDIGRDFIRRLGRPDSIVIASGLDVELFKPHFQSHIIPDNPTLLFVGRLQPGKGVENLLLAITDHRLLHVRLLIIGDGPLRTVLESYSRELKIGPRVQFLGEVKRDLLHIHHTDASLFVNPSFSEGGPLTVLEALASGIPVVSTPVGSCAAYIEASGGKGILTTGTSVSELQNGIVHALAQWRIHDRIHSHLLIAARYSWQSIASELRQVITSS